MNPLALYRQLKRNGYELDIPVERDHMLESFLKYFNLPEPDLYDPDLLEIYEASGSPGIALARTLSSCKKLLYAQDLSDAVRSIYQFLLAEEGTSGSRRVVLPHRNAGYQYGFRIS